MHFQYYIAHGKVGESPLTHSPHPPHTHIILFTLTSPKSPHVVPMARSSAVGDHAQLWIPLRYYHGVCSVCVGSSHKIKSCKIQSRLGVGVGVGVGVEGGWAEGLGCMVCMSAMGRIACYVGVIPTILQYVCIFMRVCSADYTLHYLHVTAAQLHSLPPLTSVGLSVGLHRNY